MAATLAAKGFRVSATDISEARAAAAAEAGIRFTTLADLLATTMPLSAPCRWRGTWRPW